MGPPHRPRRTTRCPARYDGGMRTLLPLLIAVGCSSTPSKPGSGGSHSAVVVDTGDTGVAETAAVHAFRFALIADPHVSRKGESLDRLRAAVAHLDAMHAETPIAFVAVLGDIAWGDGWPHAREALEALPVPWVPIQGDNPIQVGEEADFVVEFGEQLDGLATELDDWQRAPVPVEDPVYGESWLTNLSFTVDGVTFVGLDWNSRDTETVFGETPDLFDMPGGTLPFLEDSLADVAERDGLDARVITLTHMPMMHGPGFFTVDEQAELETRLVPYIDLLHANHSGHLHANADTVWEALGMEVVVTDATWDDANAVRVVDVAKTNLRVVTTHEVVEVPAR